MSGAFEQCRNTVVVFHAAQWLIYSLPATIPIVVINATVRQDRPQQTVFYHLVCWRGLTMNYTYHRCVYCRASFVYRYLDRYAPTHLIDWVCTACLPRFLADWERLQRADF